MRWWAHAAAEAIDCRGALPTLHLNTWKFSLEVARDTEPPPQNTCREVTIRSNTIIVVSSISRRRDMALGTYTIEPEG
jgi:hypothetical protein